jgi:hypothetical protein
MCYADSCVIGGVVNAVHPDVCGCQPCDGCVLSHGVNVQDRKMCAAAECGSRIVSKEHNIAGLWMIAEGQDEWQYVLRWLGSGFGAGTGFSLCDSVAAEFHEISAESPDGHFSDRGGMYVKQSAGGGLWNQFRSDIALQSNSCAFGEHQAGEWC